MSPSLLDASMAVASTPLVAAPSCPAWAKRRRGRQPQFDGKPCEPAEEEDMWLCLADGRARSTADLKRLATAARVRAKRAGRKLSLSLTPLTHAHRALHIECRGAPVVRRGDARVAPPCPTTSCVWRSLPYLTLPVCLVRLGPGHLEHLNAATLTPGISSSVSSPSIGFIFIVGAVP